MVRGPDVEPHPAVGHLDGVQGAPLRVGVEAVAEHEVPRQQQPALRGLRLLERPARQLHALLLHQRVAGRDALRAEEREAHRAADQQRVGGVEEAVDQRDLVGDLRAAEHHHERPLRRLDDRAQRDHLALEQQPGHGRPQVLRDARRRRVRPVRRAERVVHVGVAERGELARQSGVVLRLAALPAGVLEQQHAAGIEPVHPTPHLRTDHLRRLVHGGVDQLAEALAHGRQRRLRVAALRAAPDASTARAASPFSSSSSIVGSAARMRASSATRPSSSGTLKSTRASTLSPGRDLQVANRPLAERRIRGVRFAHLRRPVSQPAPAVPGRPRGSSSPTRCRTRRRPSRACRRSPS